MSITREPSIHRTTFRVCLLFLGSLALAGCPGECIECMYRNNGWPPVPLAGRWLFSAPDSGQCSMVFIATNETVTEGAIAPEGGCPRKFQMSRKWTYDQNGLTMRDHNGQPLAQLSGRGGRYDGKTASGEAVALSR